MKSQNNNQLNIRVSDALLAALRKWQVSESVKAGRMLSLNATVIRAIENALLEKIDNRLAINGVILTETLKEAERNTALLERLRGSAD